MTFYAIRRKSDGAYIPIRVGKRGQTASEPSKTEPPRLFTRRSSATSALKWWAQGIWWMSRHHTRGWEGDYDYDEELRLVGDDKSKTEASHLGMAPEEPPKRSADDFEVVRVSVRVDRRRS